MSMPKTVLCVVLCLFTFSANAADRWQQKVIDLVNKERLNADARELAIYGELAKGPRLPLVLDPRLGESGQWWCNAIKGTGIFNHWHYVNAEGFLIRSPENPVVLSRVWLPQTNGITSWADRIRFLEIPALGASENLVKANRLTPERMVYLWTASGYNDDPRLATRHYSNLIYPYWTHAGVGKVSDGGNTIAAMEFAWEIE